MALPNGCQYLGRVKRVPRRGDAYLYASIEPLIESNAAGTAWSTRIVDAPHHFPTRGLVHWPYAPMNLQAGTLWQFTMDEAVGDGPETYRVVDPIEPIEVIDVRGWTDEMALRSTITADGVQLSPAPVARRFLLRLSTGLYVGPVLLKRAADGRRWVFDSPEGHHDAARVAVWKTAPEQINEVALDGPRLFLAPPQHLGSSAGIENWSSDEEVARGVLRHLRVLDKRAWEALGVFDKVFRTYLDHLRDADAIGIDPTVVRARADRLTAVRAAIERNVTLIGEAVEVLLKSEQVSARLEQQVEVERQRLLDEKQKAVNAALESIRAQVTQTETDLAAKQAKLGDLDEALRMKQHELDEKVSSFELAVAARLEAIARRPEAMFAEMAVLRAAIGPLTSQGQAVPNGDILADAQDPGSALIEPVESRDAEVLQSPEALRAALGRHALARRLSPHAMLGLHAAFTVGAVPVVTGLRAYELLWAYASVVAGGRLLWVPVGSSVLEPQDLLGRFDPTRRHIISQPCGILDVVREATASGRLHLVVLEGFNRAPVEAYLSPIMEAAAGARGGDKVRSIPIANPMVLSPHDPYRQVSRVVWPPNVLLACLPTDGSATLPVPPHAWRYLALLDADDRHRPELLTQPIEDCSTCSVTELDPTLWRERIAAEQASTPKNSQSLSDLARALSLREAEADTAIRMQRVLLESGLPTADATAIAVVATLVPRSPLPAKRLEDVLRPITFSVPGWQATHAEVQRLRE